MRNDVRFLAQPDGELEHSVGMNGRVVSAIAWLDLRREPVVIALPQSQRYYAASLFDAWTRLIAPLGTRVTDAGMAQRDGCRRAAERWLDSSKN